jgi:hypothetical protein
VRDEGERQAGGLWAESARRHADQQREQRRAAAERARATLGRLIADHEAAAAKVRMLEGTERKETA